MSAIPVLVHNKKCLSYFKKANAIGQENAKTLAELGTKKNMALKRLIRLKAIAEDNGKYYVTEKFAGTIRFKNA